MDDRIRTTAVAAARQLLLNYRTAHPQWSNDCTPIDDIVAWLGLYVETFHPHDYPQGTYGFLEPNEDLIWLCRDLPETLRRFTLAHELGHAMLHATHTSVQLRYNMTLNSYTSVNTPALSANDPCQRPDVQEEVIGQDQQELLQEILGIGQIYDPRSERELTANIFAAELLMPIERVYSLYLAEHLPPAQLAGIFDVSSAAMLNRLAGLLTELQAEHPLLLSSRRGGGGADEGEHPFGLSSRRGGSGADEGEHPFGLSSRRGGSGVDEGGGPLWPPVEGDAAAMLKQDVGQGGRPQGPQPHSTTPPAPTREPARHPLGLSSRRGGGGVDEGEHPLGLSSRRGGSGVDEGGGPLWPPVEGDAAAMLKQDVGQGGRPQGPQPHSTTTPAPTREQPQGSNEAPSSTEKHYDTFQQAAIEAATPALIVAGPGSGKTSTLIGRVEYLVSAQRVQPQRILALTFSRKAAQEMQERLETALYSHEDAQGGSHVAMPMVSTFHAFCAELLRTRGDRVGLRPDFALIDETEGYFLLRQMAQEMRLSHYRNLAAPAHYFSDFLKAISRAKDELVTADRYQQLAQAMLSQAQDEETGLHAQKALEVAHIYMLYEQGLHRRGDTDFGGLIMLVVQLLQEFPDVCREQQERFQHILVDEFQDINRASGVLLRLLAGEQRNVWVVGDANQAIYGFRGASPANITNFQEDYPGARVLPLSRNYRSRPDIVQLAEAFRWQQLELGTDTQPVANESARPTHPDAYVTLAAASDGTNEIAGLIADIRYKLAQGYNCADIAVLCRTRARAAKITRALAANGFSVIEAHGLLGQQHIKDLISIVLLLADKSGMGILRAAHQPEHALSQNDLEALLLGAREQKHSLALLIFDDAAPLAMSTEGRHALSTLSRIMHNLLRVPSVWSLLAQYLFVETEILRTLLQGSQDKHKQALLTDYSDFLQLARRYDQQQQALHALQVQEAEARGEKPAPLPTIREQAKGFLDYLQVMLSLGQDGGNRQQGVQDDNAEQANVIHVMTVHASKGLEFPIVYLPGLISRNFPLQARSNPVPPPSGMLPSGSDDKAVHESGEACLFYVGVTRARDHLVLSYSERHGKQKARPSIYLDALLASLPAERLTRLRWEGYEDNVPTSSPDGEDDETEIIFSAQPSQHFLEAVKPEKLKVTDIENYQRCPRRYLYGTLYGFYGEDSTYQLFWQATQKTLEALQKQLIANDSISQEEAPRMFTQEEAQQLYTQHWQELGGPALPFAHIYEQHGHEVTELIRRKLLESGDSSWELGSSFTVEVAGRTITVPVDRVEVSTQRAKPVKFVRTRFGKHNDKPPIGPRELLYAHVYRQQHGSQSLELHFHNMSTGETFPIKLTARKEQSLIEDLEQAIQGLERDEYPAMPDAFLCPVCPFFLICPA